MKTPFPLFCQDRLTITGICREPNMRHLTGSPLCQGMACHLFGAKQLPESMITYSQLGNKIQGNSTQNIPIFIQENTTENIVCEMASILYRRRLLWDIAHYVNQPEASTRLPHNSRPIRSHARIISRYFYMNFRGPMLSCRVTGSLMGCIIYWDSGNLSDHRQNEWQVASIKQTLNIWNIASGFSDHFWKYELLHDFLKSWLRRGRNDNCNGYYKKTLYKLHVWSRFSCLISTLCGRVMHIYIYTSVS